MKSIAFAAAVVLSLSAPSISQAAVTVDIATSGFANGSKSGTLHLAGSQFDGQTASFGQFKLDGAYSPGGSNVTFFTYCIDLYHSLIIPGTFTIQPLTSVLSAAKAADITKLLFYNAPTTDVQSAAIQLAVWEIAFEASPSWNVDAGPFAGTFFATAGDSAAARSTANTYLASLAALATPTGVTANVLYAQNNQIQVFLSPVPEGATWGMMIVGFGIVGASMRRRAKLSYRIA